MENDDPQSIRKDWQPADFEKMSPETPPTGISGNLYWKIKDNIKDRFQLYEDTFSKAHSFFQSDIKKSEATRQELLNYFNTLQKTISAQIAEWDQRVKQAEKTGWQSKEAVSNLKQELRPLEELRQKLEERYSFFEKHLHHQQATIEARQHDARAAEKEIQARFMELQDKTHMEQLKALRQLEDDKRRFDDYLRSQDPDWETKYEQSLARERERNEKFAAMKAHLDQLTQQQEDLKKKSIERDQTLRNELQTYAEAQRQLHQTLLEEIAQLEEKLRADLQSKENAAETTQHLNDTRESTRRNIDLLNAADNKSNDRIHALERQRDEARDETHRLLQRLSELEEGLSKEERQNKQLESQTRWIYDTMRARETAWESAHKRAHQDAETQQGRIDRLEKGIRSAPSQEEVTEIRRTLAELQVQMAAQTRPGPPEHIQEMDKKIAAMGDKISALTTVTSKILPEIQAAQHTSAAGEKSKKILTALIWLLLGTAAGYALRLAWPYLKNAGLL